MRPLTRISFLLLLAMLLVPAFTIAVKRKAAAQNTKPDSPSVVSCTTAPPGMLAWWPGEGNGNDIRGSATATLNNIAFTAGEVGQAFSFNGSTSDINVPASGDTNAGANGAMTIDMWINPAAAAITNGGVALAEWNNGAGGVGAHLYLNINGSAGAATGALFVNLVDTGGTSHFIGSSGGNVVADSWQHVAATYDGTNATLYLNGSVLVGPTNIGSFTPQTTYPLDFGLRRSGPGTIRYTGAMDEMELFNRALSQTEIQNIFNAGSAGKCKPRCVTPPSDLVSWWDGDDNPFDRQDSNHGTLQNGATFGAGKVGRAFSFSGLNQRVEVPNSPSLDLTNAVTLDAWVAPSQVGEGTGGTTFIAKGDLTDANNQSYDLVYAPNGTVLMRVGNSSGLDQVASVTVLPLNTFSHIAGTYDGAFIKIYINGVLENSKASSIGAMVVNNLPLRIGANNLSGYIGLIDEVEIFNRALTEQEIQSINNAGSAGKCKPCVTPPDDLAAWYNADANTNDSSGNGNNGAAQGAMGYAIGKVGQAFSFDGSTGFVQIPNAASLNPTSAITMDAWINPTNCTKPYCAVVAKSDQDGAGRSYGMWVTGPGAAQGAGIGALHVEGSGLGIAFAFTPPGVIPNGAFTHVTAVITSGGGFALYINGVLQSVTSSGTPTLSATTSPVMIGNSDPGHNVFFNGLIDEVEIFNRALTPVEIRQVLNATRGP